MQFSRYLHFVNWKKSAEIVSYTIVWLNQLEEPVETISKHLRDIKYRNSFFLLFSEHWNAKKKIKFLVIGINESVKWQVLNFSYRYPSWSQSEWRSWFSEFTNQDGFNLQWFS